MMRWAAFWLVPSSAIPDMNLKMYFSKLSSFEDLSTEPLGRFGDVQLWNIDEIGQILQHGLEAEGGVVAGVETQADGLADGHETVLVVLGIEVHHRVVQLRQQLALVVPSPWSDIVMIRKLVIVIKLLPWLKYNFRNDKFCFLFLGSFCLVPEEELNPDEA